MAALPPGPWLFGPSYDGHPTSHPHHEHDFKKYLPKFLRHEHPNEPSTKAVKATEPESSAEVKEEERRESSDSSTTAHDADGTVEQHPESL